MAKVKVTPANIKQKLNNWRNGIGITNGVADDQLIFITGDIDVKEMVILAWENEVLISVESEGQFFSKFVYVEKISK